MKRVELSVCIPVYNAEKYLDECLDSVVNQTLKNIEIICVDDGSTDGSAEILDRYAQKNKNLTVIHQKNQGVMAARIKAYNHAKGEYIAWVDNDDVLEPEMYEKMLKMAKAKKSELVICNYRLYPRKNKRKTVWYKPYKGEMGHEFIAKNTTLWNKITAKSLLSRVNIERLFRNLGEESYHIVLIEARGISTIDEPLYNYRIGHNSVSSNTHDVKWYEQVAKYADNSYEYAKKYNYSEEILSSFRFFQLYYNTILTAVAAKNDREEVYYKARKIVLSEKQAFSGQFKKYFLEFIDPIKFFVLRHAILKNFSLAKIIAKVTLR